MDKEEFMSIFCDEIRNLMIESEQRIRSRKQSDPHKYKITSELIAKEYLLKLFLSKPSSLYELRGYNSSLEEE